MKGLLDTIAERLGQIEREVKEVRFQLLEFAASEPDTPEERGRQLLQQAAQAKSEQQKAFARVFARMGIDAKPIGAEKVQELLAAEGVRPEDNFLSRGIIEMREE